MGQKRACNELAKPVKNVDQGKTVGESVALM